MFHFRREVTQKKRINDEECKMILLHLQRELTKYATSPTNIAAQNILMKLKTIIMATTLATSAVAYAQEAASELMTPEKLWELKRIGNMAVSPDEHTLLYTVTQYSKAENKGLRHIL